MSEVRGIMLRKRYGSLCAVLTSLLPTNMAKRVICFIPSIQAAILCCWESSRTSLWCKKPYCICASRCSSMISACCLMARKHSALLKYLVGKTNWFSFAPAALQHSKQQTQNQKSFCSFLNCSLIFGKNETSASRGALSSSSTTGSTASLLLQEGEERWYSVEENTT